MVWVMGSSTSKDQYSHRQHSQIEYVWDKRGKSTEISTGTSRAKMQRGYPWCDASEGEDWRWLRWLSYLVIVFGTPEPPP